MISGLQLVQVILRVLMYGNKNNKVKSKSMKKFTLFIALILTAVFGVKTTASAQTYETEEQIEWINYAITFDEAKKLQTEYICVTGIARITNTHLLTPEVNTERRLLPQTEE